MDKNWQEMVCEKIADGMSIREIGGMKNMPSVREIRKALWDDAEFQKLLSQAMKIMQVENFSELTKIADDAEPETVAVANLRIKTRQWCMERVGRETFHTKATADSAIEDEKRAAMEADRKLYKKLNSELEARQADNVIDIASHKSD